MKVDKIKTFGEDALEWWWYLNVSEVNNEILICEFGWCFLSCSNKGFCSFALGSAHEKFDV